MFFIPLMRSTPSEMASLTTSGISFRLTSMNVNCRVTISQLVLKRKKRREQKEHKSNKENMTKEKRNEAVHMPVARFPSVVATWSRIFRNSLRLSSCFSNLLPIITFSAVSLVAPFQLIFTSDATGKIMCPHYIYVSTSPSLSLLTSLSLPSPSSPSLPLPPSLSLSSLLTSCTPRPRKVPFVVRFILTLLVLQISMISGKCLYIRGSPMVDGM